MGFIDEIKARAKADKKTIVLPETEDERTEGEKEEQEEVNRLEFVILLY